MISSIKRWVFSKALRDHENYKKRTTFSGINHCHSIFLLANGDEETCRQHTLQYQDRLRKMGKKVDVLFYFQNLSSTDNGYTKKDVKWSGKPQGEEVERILSNTYDLLISLHSTIEDHYRYLVILCNAKFKIGPHFEEEDLLYDLMIDQKDFSDTKTLIQNIDYQLKKISI